MPKSELDCGGAALQYAVRNRPNVAADEPIPVTREPSFFSIANLVWMLILSVLMSQKKLCLDSGEYIFLSHARADVQKIFSTGIVHRLLREGYYVVIDRGNSWKWGPEDRELQQRVVSFESGVRWDKQIEDLARQAGCMLALCSLNSRKRIENERPNGWIERELLIGQEQGTLLPFSIDSSLNLISDRDFWLPYLGRKFDDLHINDFGSIFQDDPSDAAGRLGQALDDVASAVFAKLDSQDRRNLPWLRTNRTVDSVTLDTALDLLDRHKQAITISRSNRSAFLVHAMPDCVDDRFTRRLLNHDLKRGRRAVKWVYGEKIAWPCGTKDTQKATHEILTYIALHLMPHIKLEDLVPNNAPRKFIEDHFHQIESSGEAYHGTLFQSELVITDLRKAKRDLDRVEDILAAISGLECSLLRFLILVRHMPSNRWRWFRRKEQVDLPSAEHDSQVVLGEVRCSEVTIGAWPRAAAEIFEGDESSLTAKLNECIRVACAGDHDPLVSMQKLVDITSNTMREWPRRQLARAIAGDHSRLYRLGAKPHQPRGEQHAKV